MVIASRVSILSMPLLVPYIEIFRKYFSTKETNKGIESLKGIEAIELFPNSRGYAT